MKKRILLILTLVTMLFSGVAYATSATLSGETAETTQVVSALDSVKIFTDVPYDHWATQYIYEAQMKGVINGYPDGTFAPEANVAVGEFIKMVATTYYKEFNYTAPTDGSHWSMPYVKSLHRVVLNEENYDYETLERTITRAEASRLLCMLHYRTHNVELYTTYDSVSNFADEATITDKTDRLAIDNCVKYGLINGHAEDNTFRPLEGLTRCQAAKILMLTITR